jgi:hypothetical protein
VIDEDGDGKDGSPVDFSLDASHDGTNWETIMEKTNQEGAALSIKTYELVNNKQFTLKGQRVIMHHHYKVKPCMKDFFEDI